MLFPAGMGRNYPETRWGAAGKRWCFLRGLGMDILREPGIPFPWFLQPGAPSSDDSALTVHRGCPSCGRLWLTPLLAPGWTPGPHPASGHSDQVAMITVYPEPRPGAFKWSLWDRGYTSPGDTIGEKESLGCCQLSSIQRG